MTVMVFQLGAALCTAAVWCLWFRHDRVSAQKDLRCILFVWYISAPVSGQWVHRFWGCVALSVYFFYSELKRQKRNRQASVRGASKTAKEFEYGHTQVFSGHSDERNPLKPMIFPCRTSHTRLFPKKHSFSYSYLFVGIPVGWRGYASNVISADIKSLPWSGGPPSNSWFNIQPADYLARGENGHGLRGKLDEYLESQNENLKDYARAYLVTAPRFLGYSFNPVSFWYLYNIKNELKAMILEVNNTFDERRMYFLKDGESSRAEAAEETIPSPEATTIAKEFEEPPPLNEKGPGKFSAAWQKDFHVSPFNSRKGGYSLSAIDPFANHPNGDLKASCGQINNTITLSSSNNHPKLIARVFSTSDGIDPYSLSKLDVIRFVLSWCWVGFVTFPRIVREAGKLFFRRKLHVWFRPEVLKDSIGRNETEDERAIAVLFRDYLKSLVEASNLPFPLQFISGIATLPPSETFTPHSLASTLHPAPLIFKPTTPLFYALLARQTDFPTFIKTTLEHQNQDPKTTIFYTSDPDLLLQLFNTLQALPQSSFPHRFLLIDLLRWGLVYDPHKQAPLDAFAKRLPPADTDKFRAYRVATLKLLVSDRVASGMLGLIDAALFLMRIWLCWICARSVDDVLGLADQEDQLAVGMVGRVVMGCVGLPLWAGIGALL